MTTEKTFDVIAEVVTVLNNARDLEQSTEISKQADTDMFNGLLGTVPEQGTLEPAEWRRVWEGNLHFGEDRWCEENFGDLKEHAMHQVGKRKGEWKYRTILPGPYTSAKNVIGKAMERGVDVTQMRGKTAIQKASKKAKESNDPSTSSYTKFVRAIDRAVEILESEGDLDTRVKMREYAQSQRIY